MEHKEIKQAVLAAGIVALTATPLNGVGSEGIRGIVDSDGNPQMTFDQQGNVYGAGIEHSWPIQPNSYSQTLLYGKDGNVGYPVEFRYGRQGNIIE